MNSVGVDIHKRYSVLVAVDERGQEIVGGARSGTPTDWLKKLGWGKADLGSERLRAIITS